MLAWDSFRCSVLDSVKQELNHGEIDPGDALNIFKHPMLHGRNHSKPKSLNNMTGGWQFVSTCILQQGTRALLLGKKIVQWILEAWNDLDKDIIVNSFKSCALTLANNDSEHELIHCLKLFLHGTTEGSSTATSANTGE